MINLKSSFRIFFKELKKKTFENILYICIDDIHNRICFIPYILFHCITDIDRLKSL